MSQRVFAFDSCPVKTTFSELSLNLSDENELTLCARTFICVLRAHVCLGCLQVVYVFFLPEQGEMGAT